MESMANAGYTVTLPAFEGPLDLLLRLIERAELDITHIALAHVADQYLAHVRDLDVPDARSLSDFVALASRLLLIKSRVLLPRPAAEEEAEAAASSDDARLLVKQLREYRRYKRAALLLRTWQEQDRQTFLRTVSSPVIVEPHYPPLEHTLQELVLAAQHSAKAAPPAAAPTPQGTFKLVRRLTVAEVIARIDAHLETQTSIRFDELLVATTTRQEVVVTFWTVLELLKQQHITVQQDALFDPIRIGRAQ